MRELKRIIAALASRDSNGSFAGYTVDHLRNHPSSSTTDTHARSLATKALNMLAAIKEAL